MPDSIASRKADHIALAATSDVGFRDKTTLFEAVQLLHDSLPELEVAAIDTGVTVLGKRLRAPLLIAGMTGGTDQAQRINEELAGLAEELGYAFGLGSQRAMLRDPAAAASYAVRPVAPTALLFGNVGMAQAAVLSTAEIEGLVAKVEADALCVHLNPAQEMIQAEGDRDFRGGLALFERLAQELSVPVIAKETGCGLSRSVATRLQSTGVRHVDVSGAGGTSWVAVETHRAEGAAQKLGELFWDWGIPTAASVASVAPLRFRTVFATGGIKNGLEAAKAIALGATVVGMARPVLQAWHRGGVEASREFLLQVERELVTAMLLVGAANLEQLSRVPRVLSPELERWLV
jgi:isopentenyl-diphosphate delta-isomerase